MNIRKLVLAAFLAIVAVSVAAPMSTAFARHGADDPAGHDAGDDRGRGGHGADDPAGHR